MHIEVAESEHSPMTFFHLKPSSVNGLRYVGDLRLAV